MKKLLLCVLPMLAACIERTPLVAPVPLSQVEVKEYAPYMDKGTASITGRAFFVSQAGTPIVVVGADVVLDPVTTASTKWYKDISKAQPADVCFGCEAVNAIARWSWINKPEPATDPLFLRARRRSMTDVDGSFTFTDLPAGRYYLRTEHDWATTQSLHAGLINQIVELRAGETLHVIATRDTMPVQIANLRYAADDSSYTQAPQISSGKVLAGIAALAAVIAIVIAGSHSSSSYGY